MKAPTKAAIIAYMGDISTLLVPLAALPYTIGDAANILPPKAKLAVTLTASFAAAALKLLQRFMERAQGNAHEEAMQTVTDAVTQGAASIPDVGNAGKGIGAAQMVVACILAATAFGCAAMQVSTAKAKATASKVAAWNASPQGVAALNGVTEAFNLTAAIYPQAAPAAGAVSLGVRMLEKGSPPTTAEIVNSVAAVSGDKKVAALVAPAIAAAIANANASGVPAAAATETVAVRVDAAVAAN